MAIVLSASAISLSLRFCFVFLFLILLINKARYLSSFEYETTSHNSSLGISCQHFNTILITRMKQVTECISLVDQIILSLITKRYIYN